MYYENHKGIPKIFMAATELETLPAKSDAAMSSNPDRVKAEQTIVGVARTAIIADAFRSGKSDKEITNLITELLNQPTGGEVENGDGKDMLKRIDNLELEASSRNSLHIYFKGDTKKIEGIENLKNSLKDYPSVEGIFSARRAGDEGAEGIEYILEYKNYQLDPKNGTLHGVSNERQYVPGQSLDDLKENFYNHSTELDQKKKYFDTYFRELAKSGAYKDKEEIKIMDIGVENGDLTKAIAESALKHFSDKKITLCAVEFTKNFLDKASNKINAIENDNLNYIPVVHLVGKRKGYETNQNITAQGEFDIILATDLNNFDTKQLLGEIAEYSSKDAVLLLKHSNEKDFLQVVKDSVDQKYIRNFGSKIPEIESPFNEAGMEFKSGEMKAAFRLGANLNSYRETQAMYEQPGLKIAPTFRSNILGKDELLKIEAADFLNQPFQNKDNDFDKVALAQQRILEFALGSPIAGFPKSVREQAINSYDAVIEQGGGVAYNVSTCQIVPVKQREISPEIKEANYSAFAAAIKSVELAQDKFTDRSWGSLKGV